jgi:hypothetical protein
MDLFDMEENLSPRLVWMRKRDIKTMKNREGAWIAYKSGTGHTFTHEGELEAIIGLARKLKLKSWKEEA